ncbi:MAG: Mss4-like protein [Monoraphidium minutum]|nr:MAG: Mss4-like protein [Monoraphidium minutum]
MTTVIHSGGCHCGAVQFEFDGPEKLIAWDCNCSICAMKRNTHTMVPAPRFRLLKGQDAQGCYEFETRIAKHLFCKTCGICSYYVPRSNPDAFAVTIYCIKPGTAKAFDIRRFDGTDWEGSFKATGIAACSREGGAPAPAP